jgi:hypothetical protein
VASRAWTMNQAMPTAIKVARTGVTGSIRASRVARAVLSRPFIDLVIRMTCSAIRHPDVLTEGPTTTTSHEQGADYHWICKPCFDDFAERFGWRVVPTAD